MYKVAFICIHNSARSQMAEELLRKYGKNQFKVYSAGIEPGNLNQTVVEILKEEEDIDIRDKKTVSVTELIEQNLGLDYIITVCDETSAERCPVFLGNVKRIHWSFEDPSSLTDNQNKKNKTIVIKDKIKSKILAWVKEIL